MIWVVLTASVVALAAVIFGAAVVVEEAYKKLGLTQIKKWKKGWVPITLVVDEDDFPPEEVARLLGAVRKAARFWNEQTGVTLFCPPEEVGTGAVVPVMRHNPLTMDEKEREDAVAYASLTVNRMTGSLSRAVVYMREWENLHSTTLARAMKHELGHCLGLAHDDIEFSVMYGKVSQRVYCVSPADKAFLQEVYG